MAKIGVLGRLRRALAASRGSRGNAAENGAHVRKVVARLAGGVAHDLNNILLVVQGYAEMATEEAEATPGVLSLLVEMRSATSRAATLVRDLMVVGERAAFVPRLFDLSEMVRRRLPDLESGCPRGIEIRVSLASGLPPVLADEDQVARMLEALCARARESMPAGGGISITTKPGPGGGSSLLVSDNGTPLSAEMRARLFEPYLPGPGGGKGQGLGMSVAQAVVRRLGGEIRADSAAGGTSIEVLVPAGVERAAPVSPTGTVETPDTPTVPDGTAVRRVPPGGTAILVAEDDEGLREMAVKVLSREGYTVVPARDGQEAVELFTRERGRIRLVLLDDVMPRLGGRAALARIHTMDPEVPLVLCSGYDWRLGEQSPETGARPRTLAKPWQPRDLLRVVREALDTSP